MPLSRRTCNLPYKKNKMLCNVMDLQRYYNQLLGWNNLNNTTLYSKKTSKMYKLKNRTGNMSWWQQIRQKRKYFSNVWTFAALTVGIAIISNSYSNTHWQLEMMNSHAEGRGEEPHTLWIAYSHLYASVVILENKKWRMAALAVNYKTHN